MPGGRRAQHLRLWSGVVLFAFVATHLLNHALGLISLEAMETGRDVFLGFWRNPGGTALLAGALAIHVVLALAKLFRGRSLRLPAWEWAQLLLGLAIPFLLAQHVLATRGLAEAFGMNDTYAYVLFALWPDGAARQLLLLLIVWVHGCIGLHFWLQLKRWYARTVPILYAAAVLLPALSFVGFAVGGREVKARAAAPGWLDALDHEIGWLGEAAAVFVERGEAILLALATLVLAALAAVRLARLWYGRRRGGVRLVYPGGRVVVVAAGSTVLEASRMAGIPHASVCGGRGRCSTCRIRIGPDVGSAPPANQDERKVLDRIHAPPNVRLACQLRPAGPLDVMPLLPPHAGPRDARPQPAWRYGSEREIAILFADLRAFTRLSERKLPYDVVFLLNQYFRAMGRAIELSGGHLDKFIGDGVMALFGIEDAPDAACRNALAAVRAMAETLEELNRSLAHDLPEPLRIGIGLHAGAVIVGEMGYKAATSITAIGDPVNVASRLEAMTKDFACQAIVSDSVVRRAGSDLSMFPVQEITVRGRERPLSVFVIADGRDIPETLPAPQPADSGAGRTAA